MFKLANPQDHALNNTKAFSTYTLYVHITDIAISFIYIRNQKAKTTHANMSSLRIKNKISHKLVPENSQEKCIITKNMNIEKSY